MKVMNFFKEWKYDLILGFAGGVANGISQQIREESIHAVYVIGTGIVLTVIVHFVNKWLKK